MILEDIRGNVFHNVKNNWIYALTQKKIKSLILFQDSELDQERRSSLATVSCVQVEMEVFVDIEKTI